VASTRVASDAVRGWLVSVFFALVLALTPVPAWVVDQFYSRAVYPTIQSWLTTATNLVPFAVLDFILIAGVFLTARRVVKLWSVLRQEGVLEAAWEGACRFVRAAALLTVFFMLVWGLNYRRLPIDTAMAGATAPPPTVAALEAILSDANVLASRLRGPAAKAKLNDFRAVEAELAEPMNAALEHIGRPALEVWARPKHSLVLTPFFITTGVDGMIDPLMLETIVNPDLLPFERPFVLAHEWAHLSGIGDEAEASAVGWLACMKGSPPLAYSASLYLIMEARAAMPVEARTAVNARLDAGVRSDLEVIADRLKRENPRMQRAATRVYEQFLRVNRVGDGTLNDDRALALILTPRVLEAMGSYTFGQKAD
jgi:hypothetical protein